MENGWEACHAYERQQVSIGQYCDDVFWGGLGGERVLFACEYTRNIYEHASLLDLKIWRLSRE